MHCCQSTIDVSNCGALELASSMPLLAPVGWASHVTLQHLHVVVRGVGEACNQCISGCAGLTCVWQSVLQL
jgi:hypothetical protein